MIVGTLLLFQSFKYKTHRTNRHFPHQPTVLTTCTNHQTTSVPTKQMNTNNHHTSPQSTHHVTPLQSTHHHTTPHSATVTATRPKGGWLRLLGSHPVVV